MFEVFFYFVLFNFILITQSAFVTVNNNILNSEEMCGENHGRTITVGEDLPPLGNISYTECSQRIKENFFLCRPFLNENLEDLANFENELFFGFDLEKISEKSMNITTEIPKIRLTSLDEARNDTDVCILVETTKNIMMDVIRVKETTSFKVREFRPREIIDVVFQVDEKSQVVYFPACVTTFSSLANALEVPKEIDDAWYCEPYELIVTRPDLPGADGCNISLQAVITYNTGITESRKTYFPLGREEDVVYLKNTPSLELNLQSMKVDVCPKISILGIVGGVAFALLIGIPVIFAMVQCLRRRCCCSDRTDCYNIQRENTFESIESVLIQE